MTRTIELRSDTFTTPTPEMRRAMADAEVGDDEYGEDPTVNRLQSLAAALLGNRSGAVRAVGDDGEPARDPRAVASRAPRCCARRASHVYQYEAAAVAAEQRRADASVVGRPRRHRRRDRGHGARVPARLDARAREHVHGDVGRADRRRRDAHARAASRATGGLRVHVDGARIWNAAIATGAPPRELDRRRRHRDVLPVEGSERAGRLGAVRPGRRDRRGARAAPPARRRDAPGGRDRGRGHRRARDDGRAARRRPRPRPPPRRRARRALAGQRRSRDGAHEHRVRAARRAARTTSSRGSPRPACASGRSTRARCGSSRTRTSTTTTSTRAIAALDELRAA